jgi:PAS domain S-box-containing protein
MSKLISEEALRESEQFNLQVINNAEEGIIVYGTDLRYHVWNPFMERFSGLPPSEVIGRHPQELFPFLAEEGMLERLEKIMEDQSASSFEFPFHSPHNGCSGWALDTSSPLKNSKGEIIGVIGMVRDITARKQAEEELNRKNADIEQFLYSVSHDLRSPLVTIKTFTGYLENDMAGCDSERTAQDLQFINSAADKMKLLLDELLEMSRVDRVETAPVRVSLREVLDEVLAALAGVISERELDIRLPVMELILFGEYPRLFQIWQNLIENAIKYSRSDRIPRIEVGFEQLNGETVFFVRDNGIGIAREYIARIFGMFDKLNPKSPGAGLGLSMVKRIVEKSDGRIWAESDGIGEGASFYFTLPKVVVQG